MALAAAARRRVIAPAALKGYLLEEALAFLVRGAGYNLLTRPDHDPHDLAARYNGLQVIGRGGYHQVDVLGELSWTPAFSSPIRLFVEAKWRDEGTRVGIPEVREAVGIVNDINQNLATIKRGASVGDDDTPERLVCYNYRYAIFSTSGFSEDAQRYALAHQIVLIDVSGDDFSGLRDSISDIAETLVETFERAREGNEYSEPEWKRNGFVKDVRQVFRRMLWEGMPMEQAQSTQQVFVKLSADFGEIKNKVKEIDELFVGMTNGGLPLFMRASDTDLFRQHMALPADPYVTVWWEPRNAAADWYIRIDARHGLDECTLSFRLPRKLLRMMERHAEMQAQLREALSIKQAYLSRITVFHVFDGRTMVCNLNLDNDWLREARTALDRLYTGKN